MKNKIAAGLIGLGIGLRVSWFWLAPLWYDEAFTAWLSQIPLSNMILATAGDTHPPLYYFFTWIIGHLFGINELTMRLPSVIFSCSSLFVFWFILAKEEKLLDPVKLIALGLMAVMPFQLHFAQEARQYALLTLLVLLGYYSIQIRKYTFYVLIQIMILYTHNYGIFYFGFLALIATLAEIQRPVHVHTDPNDPNTHPDLLYLRPVDESKTKQVLIYSVLAGIAFIPWIFALVGQMGTVSDGYWIQDIKPGSIIYVLYMLWWSFTTDYSWQPVASMITIALSIAVLITAKKYKSFGLMAWGPLIMAVLGSVIWKPILLFRGLTGSAPFIYALAAAAFGSVKQKYLQVLFAVMVLPIIGAGLVGFYKNNPGQKTGDMYQFIETLNTNWIPGDVIIHANDGSLVGYHLYQSDKPQYRLRSVCTISNLGSLTDQTRDNLGVKYVDDLSQFDRVWFVYHAGPTATKCHENEAEKIINQSKTYLEISTEMVTTGLYLWQKQ
jgi:uncharacterized membrane protein